VSGVNPPLAPTGLRLALTSRGWTAPTAGRTLGGSAEASISHGNTYRGRGMPVHLVSVTINEIIDGWWFPVSQ
jgi:hypothetical protein